jgi:hypothetical protein
VTHIPRPSGCLKSAAGNGLCALSSIECCEVGFADGSQVRMDSIPEVTVSPPNECLRPKRPKAREWIFRSTLGDYRRSRGLPARVFAHWALTNGIFADRRSRDDRLGPWEVGSNCCSDEGQSCDTFDQGTQLIEQPNIPSAACWVPPRDPFRQLLMQARARSLQAPLV